MDHLLPGVDALVELEHRTIVEKWGEGYNSPHEAYAVMLEEVQEAQENMKCLQAGMEIMWTAIREDNRKQIGPSVVRIEHYAKQLAAEAVQVAAVCRRARGNSDGNA